MALPVRYHDELLAVLWCSQSPAAAASGLDAEALKRLAGAVAPVLRGAMVGNDLEAWGLPLEELEDMDL